MAPPTPPNPPTPPSGSPNPSPNDRRDGVSPQHSTPPSAKSPALRRAQHPATPALRRTVIRPAGASPEPTDSAFVVTRLTALTHELNNLLSGSLRVLGMAQRAVQGSQGSGGEICPEMVSRQLDTVAAAMRQMADLVRSTTVGMAEGGIAGLRSGFGSSSSLADAVRHAVDVMMPLAQDARVRLEADVGPELAEISAGPIYSVITNAIRNAIESIEQTPEARAGLGGRVHVRAWAEAGKTGRCVKIEVTDDGMGPPPCARGAISRTRDDAIFRIGYTTKPGHSGVGLSLSRDVIEQLGGSIQLIACELDPVTGRGGAILEVCYPIPSHDTRAAS